MRACSTTWRSNSNKLDAVARECDAAVGTVQRWCAGLRSCRARPPTGFDWDTGCAAADGAVVRDDDEVAKLCRVMGKPYGGLTKSREPLGIIRPPSGDGRGNLAAVTVFLGHVASSETVARGR